MRLIGLTNQHRLLKLIWNEWLDELGREGVEPIGGERGSDEYGAPLSKECGDGSLLVAFNLRPWPARYDPDGGSDVRFGDDSVRVHLKYFGHVRTPADLADALFAFCAVDFGADAPGHFGQMDRQRWAKSRRKRLAARREKERREGPREPVRAFDPDMSSSQYEREEEEAERKRKEAPATA
ncbi:MAG TPA: hypothetical protein VFS43_40785 [Polyangiaceae bacterium]|nr:hypothetical protein [Polyangiaceae bacterium]